MAGHAVCPLSPSTPTQPPNSCSCLPPPTPHAPAWPPPVQAGWCGAVPPGGAQAGRQAPLVLGYCQRSAPPPLVLGYCLHIATAPLDCWCYGQLLLLLPLLCQGGVLEGPAVRNATARSLILLLLLPAHCYCYCCCVTGVGPAVRNAYMAFITPCAWLHTCMPADMQHMMHGRTFFCTANP